jgi:hypothetical protein
VVRFVPSIPGYVYAVRDESLYVNLYVGGTATVEVGGDSVTLRQQTHYPWTGDIRIEVDPQTSDEFALRLRIPGWAMGKPVPSTLYRYSEATAAPYLVKLNGKTIQPPIEKGYAVLKRAWQSGDVVELDLPMPIRRVLAHDNVAADRGRVALERGPLVYCLEAADNDGSVYDVVLSDKAELESRPQSDLLGGVTVLTGTASRAVRQDDGSVALTPAAITAIPYYAWAHREIGEMAVWLARDPNLARVKPAPTLASDASVSASHCGSSDTVEALHDQIEPRSSIDHDISRFTWWDHRGSTEWIQYDLAKEAEVSTVEVYWFDDTGRGQCRLPKSWRLLYRDNNEWKPVAATSAYDIAKDKFNKVQFASVTTNALRLEVQLQDNFSSGVLEWRVRP